MAETGNGAGTKISGSPPTSCGERRFSTPLGPGTMTGPTHSRNETTTRHGLRCPASAMEWSTAARPGWPVNNGIQPGQSSSVSR